VPGGGLVDDRLWVSSFMAGQSKRKELLAAGITHIVNCTDTFPCKYPNDFRYLHLPLLDQNNQQLLPALDAACDFIAAAQASGGAVLVHCASGHSRSGSTALAHIMRSRAIGYEAGLGLGRIFVALYYHTHPFHTRFANMFSASISEATMRPDPMLGGARHRAARSTGGPPDPVLCRAAQNIRAAQVAVGCR
jgi:hypothetical protein